MFTENLYEQGLDWWYEEKPYNQILLSIGTNPLEDTNRYTSNYHRAVGNMYPTKEQRRCNWRTLDSEKNCKLGEL